LRHTAAIAGWTIPCHGESRAAPADRLSTCSSPGGGRARRAEGAFVRAHGEPPDAGARSVAIGVVQSDNQSRAKAIVPTAPASDLEIAEMRAHTKVCRFRPMHRSSSPAAFQVGARASRRIVRRRTVGPVSGVPSSRKPETDEAAAEESQGGRSVTAGSGAKRRAITDLTAAQTSRSPGGGQQCAPRTCEPTMRRTRRGRSAHHAAASPAAVTFGRDRIQRANTRRPVLPRPFDLLRHGLSASDHQGLGLLR